jgi:hypothetical protein
MKVGPYTGFLANFGKILFAVMAKRTMSNIVSQSYCLEKILVQSQKAANGPGYLGDQLDMEDSMGNVVVVDKIKNLSFVNIPGIGQGMKYAIRIHGEIRSMAVLNP